MHDAFAMPAFNPQLKLWINTGQSLIWMEVRLEELVLNAHKHWEIKVVTLDLMRLCFKIVRFSIIQTDPTLPTFQYDIDEPKN